MNPTVAKLLSIFGLFAVSLCPGLLPWLVLPPRDQPTRRWYHLSRRARGLVVSLASCLAGGVFLATALLDILVSVQNEFDNLWRKADVSVSFPMAELTACVGFLLILATEQVVLLLRDSSSVLELGHSTGSEGSSRPASVRAGTYIVTAECANNVPVLDVNSDPIDANVIPSKLRSAVLFIAISVHSIFEGLTVGLQGTSTQVWALLIALIPHKSVIAFTLGVTCVQTIGMVISSQTGFTAEVISTTLQGLACGTFLFVTFSEVLPLGFRNSKWRMQKVMATIVGFSFMTGLIALLAD